MTLLDEKERMNLFMNAFIEFIQTVHALSPALVKGYGGFIQLPPQVSGS